MNPFHYKYIKYKSKYLQLLNLEQQKLTGGQGVGIDFKFHNGIIKCTQFYPIFEGLKQAKSGKSYDSSYDSSTSDKKKHINYTPSLKLQELKLNLDKYTPNTEQKNYYGYNGPQNACYLNSTLQFINQIFIAEPRLFNSEIILPYSDIDIAPFYREFFTKFNYNNPDIANTDKIRPYIEAIRNNLGGVFNNNIDQWESDEAFSIIYTRIFSGAGLEVGTFGDGNHRNNFISKITQSRNEPLINILGHIDSNPDHNYKLDNITKGIFIDRKSNETITYSNLPKYLIINIRREKNVQGEGIGVESGGEKNMLPLTFKDDKNILEITLENKKYNLQSFIVHNSTGLNCGHYINYSLLHDSTPDSNWGYFSDTTFELRTKTYMENLLKTDNLAIVLMFYKISAILYNFRSIQIQLVPHGVLGTQLIDTGTDKGIDSRITNISPKVVIVDAAGLDYLHKNNIDGAGGVSKAIYTEIGLYKNRSPFPSQVIDQFGFATNLEDNRNTKRGTAVFHQYNHNKSTINVIHVVGPDKQDSKEVFDSLLEKAYFSVLEKFIDISQKSEITELWFLPISGGIFAPPGRNIAEYTVKAFINALSKIVHNYLTNLSIKMCIYKQNEFQKFEEAFKKKE